MIPLGAEAVFLIARPMFLVQWLGQFPAACRVSLDVLQLGDFAALQTQGC